MEVTSGKAINSVLWKFLERSSVQVTQFVITIILARILTPSEYGIIALIMVFINICQVIVDGGLNTALIQKKNADEVDFSTIFYFGLFMSFGLYVLLYVVAPLIASFYAQEELVPVVRVMSLILFPFAVNSVQSAYVSRNFLFKKMFLCNIVSVITSGIVGIICAYTGWGVWALVAQMLVAQISLTIIMLFVLRWRPLFFFSVDSFNSLFSYGWKIFSTNVLIAIFANLRKLIVGKFYTPESLAYFERGEHMPNLVITNIQSSIQSVMFPVFSKEQGNRTRIKQMLRRSTKMSCFIIYPLMMLLIVSAKPLVLLLLTEKWLPTVAFIQIFCIANFFRPITIPNLEAIKALGYSGITLKLEVIKKIVDISLLVSAMFFGVYAIAWSIVLFNFTCVFINLYPNKRLLDYGIAEQIKDAVPTLLLTLIMGMVVFWIQFLNLPLIVILFTQYVVGALFYVYLCFVVREESFVYLKNMILNRFK